MRTLFLLLVPLAGCSPVDPKIGFEDDVDDTPDINTDDTGIETGGDDTGDTIEVIDNDNDGFSSDEDCDDSDAAINPDADELCDGIDNDCDGDIDVGAVDAPVWYDDDDRDGFGTSSRGTVSCVQPPNSSGVGGDCDDTNPEVFPGQIEICDGIDNDCSTATSEEGSVSFYDDDLGRYTDETALFESGTFSTPVEYTTTREGVLTFCGGEWFASLTIDAPTEIVGVGGADKNILNGARDVRLIEVEEDLILRDMTLTLGQAPTSSSNQSYGGALLCDSGASIMIDGVVISQSEAYLGGGIYLSGCTTEIYNSEIRDNAATQGGAIGIGKGDVYIENSNIADNTASYYGGAFYTALSGSSSTSINVELVDSLVQDNASGYYGSALYAYPYYRSGNINISCERTSSGSQGGFLGNVDGYSTNYSGAIYLMNYYGGLTFASTGCDFGTEGSSNDNSPKDITLYGSYPPVQYDFGNGATFACSGTSCL